MRSRIWPYTRRGMKVVHTEYRLPFATATAPDNFYPTIRRYESMRKREADKTHNACGATAGDTPFHPLCILLSVPTASVNDTLVHY